MNIPIVKPNLVSNYFSEKENNEYIYFNRKLTFTLNKQDNTNKKYIIYDFSNGQAVSTDLISNYNPESGNELKDRNNYLYDEDTGIWYYNDIYGTNLDNTQDDGQGNDNNYTGGSSGNNNSGNNSFSSGGNCGCPNVKFISVNTNRKKTHILLTYTTKDNVDIIIEKIINTINTNVIITTDERLKGGETVQYTATIYNLDNTILEEISETTTINNNGNSTVIKVNFTQPSPKQYYLRVNGKEDDKWVYDYIKHNSNTITVNIESNIEYNLRIYSSKGYDFFRINREQLDGLTTIKDCSGNMQITIDIDEYNYIPTMSEIGERDNDTYSISVYSYGGNTSNFTRGIEITVEVIDRKYEEDVNTIFYHLVQYAYYAEPENQVAEMDMSEEIRNGHLYSDGGSFTFRLKPKCFWYIRSEYEEGFGVPNALNFSPAEGGPSNDWITITCSWTAGNALYSVYRQIIMQIKSILTDKVICEKTWNGVTYKTLTWWLLPYQLINNPSGELPESSVTAQDWLTTLAVISSYCGIETSLRGTSMVNKLSIYKEARIVYIYVKSNITFKLEREKLPSGITITYYYSPTSVEGQPGQHIYKVEIDENNTGETKKIDIEFSSTDNRFHGSTISHITQYSTYRKNILPEDEKYSLVKEAIMWPFESQYNSLNVTTTANLDYFLALGNTVSYNLKYLSDYTVDNPCPPSVNKLIQLSHYENLSNAIYLWIKNPDDQKYTYGDEYIEGCPFICFRLGEPKIVRHIIS